MVPFQDFANPFICQKFTSIPSSPAKLLLILQRHNFLWSIPQLPRQNSDSFCPPTALVGVTTLFITMHCNYLFRSWESIQSRYHHLFVSPCQVILCGTYVRYGEGRTCKLPCCYCKGWENTKLEMTGTSSWELGLQEPGVTLGMGIEAPNLPAFLGTRGQVTGEHSLVCT